MTRAHPGRATWIAPRHQGHGPREDVPYKALTRAALPVLADGEAAADVRSKWR